MKLRTLITKDRLRAVTRQMSQRVAEEYAAEPNIKLTSAFIVVLVLHIVAVGGIYAFNSIKTSRITSTLDNPASARRNADEKPAVANPAVSSTPARTHRVRPGETLEKIAALYGMNASDLDAANDLKNTATLRVGQELSIPAGTAPKIPAAAKAVASASPATRVAQPPPKPAKETTTKDAGETYTVAKGDTPAGIARKLGVKQSELLKLNKIEDPRKLQIGQKLRIPPKAKS